MASIAAHNEVNHTGAVTDPSVTDANEKPQPLSILTAGTSQPTSTTSAARPTTDPGNASASTPKEIANPDISRQQSASESVEKHGVESPKDAQSAAVPAKKPAAFKSVSITKSFLAKTTAAPAAPVTTKLGNKGNRSLSKFQVSNQDLIRATGTSAPAQQSILKPRLVAKSGVATLRDAPRSKSATDGPQEGGTVWNKNRRQSHCTPLRLTLTIHSDSCCTGQAIHRRGAETTIWHTSC